MEEIPGSAGCGWRQVIRSIRQGLLAKGVKEPLARLCAGSNGFFYHGPALLSCVNANPALCLTIQIANRDTGRASSDSHAKPTSDFSAVKLKASLANYLCRGKIRGAGVPSCHLLSRAQHLFRADGADVRGGSTRGAWRGVVPPCMCPESLPIISIEAPPETGCAAKVCRRPWMHAPEISALARVRRGIA